MPPLNVLPAAQATYADFAEQERTIEARAAAVLKGLRGRDEILLTEGQRGALQTAKGDAAKAKELYPHVDLEQLLKSLEASVKPSSAVGPG